MNCKFPVKRGEEIMEDEYYELDYWGNLEGAVEKLLQWRDTYKNRKAKIEFNGHWLYSDTVSMDKAYLEVLGKSKSDFDKEQDEWRKNLKEREEEHKEKIPQLTKEWINKGHQILEQKFWDTWDKCVPIRLSDLYEGMELGMCLDIIKTINEKSLQEAVGVMISQGHSGMSWGLMKSMVRSFSDKGEEFIALLDEIIQ